ncbi:hypothetical protein BaRGS_00031088, partial [Batillaria attramentaria]
VSRQRADSVLLVGILDIQVLNTRFMPTMHNSDAITVCVKGGSGVYLTMGTVVTYVGKFALSGCYNTLFVFCLEVFPTTLRSVGMGVASTVSRLPGMAAPFFILLGETIPWAPGVIFGGMCVLAGLSVLLLPETRHRALPNTIEEIREWKNRPPVKRCLMKETGGMDEHISA